MGELETIAQKVEGSIHSFEEGIENLAYRNDAVQIIATKYEDASKSVAYHVNRHSFEQCLGILGSINSDLSMRILNCLEPRIPETTTPIDNGTEHSIGDYFTVSDFSGVEELMSAHIPKK